MSSHIDGIYRCIESKIKYTPLTELIGLKLVVFVTDFIRFLENSLRVDDDPQDLNLLYKKALSFLTCLTGPNSNKIFIIIHPYGYNKDYRTVSERAGSMDDVKVMTVIEACLCHSNVKVIELHTTDHACSESNGLLIHIVVDQLGGILVGWDENVLIFSGNKGFIHFSSLAKYHGVYSGVVLCCAQLALYYNVPLGLFPLFLALSDLELTQFHSFIKFYKFIECNDIDTRFYAVARFIRKYKTWLSIMNTFFHTLDDEDERIDDCFTALMKKYDSVCTKASSSNCSTFYSYIDAHFYFKTQFISDINPLRKNETEYEICFADSTFLCNVLSPKTLYVKTASLRTVYYLLYHMYVQVGPSFCNKDIMHMVMQIYNQTVEYSNNSFNVYEMSGKNVIKQLCVPLPSSNESTITPASSDLLCDALNLRSCPLNNNLTNNIKLYSQLFNPSTTFIKIIVGSVLMSVFLDQETQHFHSSFSSSKSSISVIKNFKLFQWITKYVYNINVMIDHVLPSIHPRHFYPLQYALYLSKSIFVARQSMEEEIERTDNELLTSSYKLIISDLVENNQ